MKIKVTLPPEIQTYLMCFPLFESSRKREASTSSISVLQLGLCTLKSQSLILLIKDTEYESFMK